MGDPNGTRYWGGQYHLFYQHNPDEAFDNPRRMHWGHAASADLVHWEDMPIALTPERGGADEKGCYSGAAFEIEGVPALVYYGAPHGICIASSGGSLGRWRKWDANPVIPRDISQFPVPHWHPWDPFIWRDGDVWSMIMGGRWDEGRDTCFLFQSRDLIDWEYQWPFYEPGYESDCSVPDFFPLGGKYVLNFSSHERGPQYYVGSYSKGRFVPQQHGRMTFPLNRMEIGRNSDGVLNLESGNLLANNTLLDGIGRRIFFGWVSEGRTEAVQRESGWSGVMCLPRVLGLSADDKLESNPVPELEMIRGHHWRREALVVDPEVHLDIPPNIPGDCMEINVKVGGNSADKFGVSILRSMDGLERTEICYDRGTNTLTLDVDAGSLDPSVPRGGLQQAPVDLGQNGSLGIRVFVDHSIVEVFANGQCIVKRVYPTKDESRGVALFSSGGPVPVESVDCWEMKSVWD